MAALQQYKGLNLLQSVDDAEAIRVLLEGTRFEKVFCDQCESSKFEILVLKECRVVVNADENHVLILDETVERASVVRIIKCAVCGETVFVTEEQRE